VTASILGPFEAWGERPTMADTPAAPAAPAKPAKQESKERPSRDDKSEKGEKHAGPAIKKDDQFGPDFRYLVRLVNTDLDGRKPVGVALTYVPGVSHRLAAIVARQAGVPLTERMGNLKDPQIEAVNKAIEGLTETLPVWMVNRRHDPESGDDMHLVGSEIQIYLREDLNNLKKIRSWRGHRHERKLPTRGQRTKNNGRFGSAVGVQRKDVAGAPPAEGAAPAAAAPKAGGGGAKPLGGAKPPAGGKK
jgi:small subunit ribosomal protein S13